MSASSMACPYAAFRRRRTPAVFSLPSVSRSLPCLANAPATVGGPCRRVARWPPDARPFLPPEDCVPMEASCFEMGASKGPQAPVRCTGVHVDGAHRGKCNRDARDYGVAGGL